MGGATATVVVGPVGRRVRLDWKRLRRTVVVGGADGAAVVWLGGGTAAAREGGGRPPPGWAARKRSAMEGGVARGKGYDA